MSIRKMIVRVLAFILASIVGLSIWFVFIRDVEPVENQLPTATPALESQIYTVDTEETSLDFIIELAGSDVEGTFQLAAGTLEVQPAVEGGWRLVANLIIDGNSVDTGNRLINGVMKLSLEAEKYPYGVFTGRSSQTFDDPTQEQTVTLEGQLEISGVTQPYSTEADFRVVEGVAYVESVLVIDLAEFGVSFPEQIGSTVLDVNLALVAPEGAPEEPLPLLTPTVPAEDEVTPTPENAEE